MDNLDRFKAAGGSVLEGNGNRALLAGPLDHKRSTLDNIEVGVGEFGLGEDSGREGDDGCDGELHYE